MWTAPLSGERAITSVDSALTGGRADLTWDSPKGLLNAAGPLSLDWTADELLASVQVQRGPPGRKGSTASGSYVYDAFSRIVRVIRDGHTLDRI